MKRVNSLKTACDIAISRGGKCLSDHFIKLSDDLNWECEFKHTWAASLSSIKYNIKPILFSSITLRSQYTIH